MSAGPGGGEGGVPAGVPCRPPDGGDRARTVAALRERIARLGGLPGHRAGRGTDAGPSSVPAPSPASPGDGWAGSGRSSPQAPPGAVAPPGTRALGFVPEPLGDAVVWVRRVTIDLEPLLLRAGAPSPAGAAQLRGLTHPDPAGGPPQVAVLRHAVASAPAAVAVLDIESIGLRGSGVVPFLVGVGVADGARLHVDQLLLADPGAEAALLAAAGARVAAADHLVTYNGRTFDLPVLVARSIVNRLSPAPFEVRLHCDLLGPVRRLFRDRLGACTLRHAEISLLGLERVDDVPGSEAAARYRAWLRGVGAPVLAGVVRHNEQDLCSTMVLAARLAAHVEGLVVEPPHPADRYHLAVHLERRGMADQAEGHYRAALTRATPPWDRRAGARLARHLRRLGPDGAAEATRILEVMWREDPADLRGARALAVALERLGRLGDALAVCDRSLDVCARLGAWRLERMRAAPRGGWEEDWHRRRRRLALRTARSHRRARSCRSREMARDGGLRPRAMTAAR